MRAAIVIACIALCALLPGGAARVPDGSPPDVHLHVAAGAACQGLVVPCPAVEAPTVAVAPPRLPDLPALDPDAALPSIQVNLGSTRDQGVAPQSAAGRADTVAPSGGLDALPPAAQAAGASALLAGIAAFAAWLTSKLPWGTEGGRRLLRMAALAPAALFSRIAPDDLVQHPARQAMLDHLRLAPGATLREAQRAAGVAWGTAVYHLQRLEHDGHVVSLRQGAHRRFWVSNTAASARRREAAPLLDDEARRLAQAVVASPGANQASLAAAAGLSAATACRRLRALQRAGLVEVAVTGRARSYRAAATLAPLLGPDVVRLVPVPAPQGLVSAPVDVAEPASAA